MAAVRKCDNNHGDSLFLLSESLAVSAFGYFFMCHSWCERTLLEDVALAGPKGHFRPFSAKLGQEAFSRHLKGQKMHLWRKRAQTPTSFLSISLNLGLFSLNPAFTTCPGTFFRPTKCLKKFYVPQERSEMKV